jgi:hypothetical protein
MQKCKNAENIQARLSGSSRIRVLDLVKARFPSRRQIKGISERTNETGKEIP